MLVASSLLKENVVLAVLIGPLVMLPASYFLYKAILRHRVYFNGRVFVAVDYAGRIHRRLLAREVLGMRNPFAAGSSDSFVELHFKSRVGQNEVWRFRDNSSFPFRLIRVAVEYANPEVELLVYGVVPNPRGTIS